MNLGGGSGGGVSSKGALGIAMEPLEENDDGDGREGVRELQYRRSKPGFGSYTRMDGVEVK
jgi:hypothetical protein